MTELKPGDWVLFMNDMRFPQIENHDVVCMAETREELIALLERERVEPYKDDKWCKVHTKGGPLEWMNSLDDEHNGYCFEGLVQYFPPEHVPPSFPSIDEL